MGNGLDRPIGLIQLRPGGHVTKQEFIAKVAAKSGLSNRDAGKAVDAFLESVIETLKAGDSVNFTGFGKFSAASRAARMGVNPQTGERVRISATTVPKFSAGSHLKGAMHVVAADSPGNPTEPWTKKPK